MLRSTVNATGKTIAPSGMLGQSLEHVHGSSDGILADGFAEESETTAAALTGNTYIVPSNKHHIG